MTVEDFYRAVADVLRTARTTAYRDANFAMVEAYRQVGRMIVEDELVERGQDEGVRERDANDAVGIALAQLRHESGSMEAQ